MAYTKQTWSNGDVITKSKLDHIEDGIANAQSTADGAASSINALSANGAIGTANLANGAVTLEKLDESATDIVADMFNDLKSAIETKAAVNDILNGYTSIKLLWEHGWVNSNGNYDSTSSRHLSQTLPTSAAKNVINNSASTVYIVYFSAFTDLHNFTYDSFVSVQVGATGSIDTDKSYFMVESIATTESGLEGVVLAKDSDLDYLSKSNINNIVNAILQRDRLGTAYVSNNNISWYTGGADNAYCYLTISNQIVIRSNRASDSATVIPLATFMSAVSASGVVTVSDGVISGNGFAIVYDFSTESIKVYSPSNVNAYKNTMILFLHQSKSITTGELAINARVKQFEQLEAQINGTLPDYLINEATDCRDKLIAECGEKAMIIAFTTDNHYGASNGMNFPTTIKTIKKVNELYPLDIVVDGGDLINGDETKVNATNRMCSAVSMLCNIKGNAYTLLGNHDDDSYTSSELPLFSKAELYAMMCRHEGIELDYVDDGEQYGYKDFPQYGLRVIVLDSMWGANGHEQADWGYSDAELAWFTSDALNTSNQIVMFSHMAFTPDYIAYGATIKNGTAMRGAVENFIANGGVVVGLFNGHNHWDYIGQYSQINGFHEVSTGCGRIVSGPTIPYAHPEGATMPERTADTVTQELWDIIVIKPESRTVNMIRFGAGSDRSFTY